MQLPTGRRSGCDFYWLDGHFEMPEYPGQLNKFFGKNGFPTEKKHTDIESVSYTHLTLPTNREV